MAEEKRYFNVTSLLDPHWNLLNCSEHTEYLAVGGLFSEPLCICARGWIGGTCSEYQPSAFFIRFIGTQIIGGTCYILLGLLAIALILSVIVRRPMTQPSRLRIASCSSFLLCIAIRFIWILDGGEYNEDIRLIPLMWDSLLYWLPYGFATFSATAILSLWLELLTTKYVVFQAKWASKLSIVLGSIWLAICIALETIRLTVQFSAIDILSHTLAVLTAGAASITGFIIAIIVRRRHKEMRKMGGKEREPTEHQYVLKVAKHLLIAPIPFLAMSILAVYVVALILIFLMCLTKKAPWTEFYSLALLVTHRSSETEETTSTNPSVERLSASQP